MAISAGLCELDYFCNEAHLHRKGPILRQIHAYYLIYIHATSKGAPRHYLLGSAVCGAFHPLRVPCELQGIFLSHFVSGLAAAKAAQSFCEFVIRPEAHFLFKDTWKGKGIKKPHWSH